MLAFYVIGRGSIPVPTIPKAQKTVCVFPCLVFSNVGKNLVVNYL